MSYTKKVHTAKLLFSEIFIFFNLERFKLIILYTKHKKLNKIYKSSLTKKKKRSHLKTNLMLTHKKSKMSKKYLELRT